MTGPRVTAMRAKRVANGKARGITLCRTTGASGRLSGVAEINSDAAPVDVRKTSCATSNLDDDPVGSNLTFIHQPTEAAPVYRQVPESMPRRIVHIVKAQ